MIFINTRPVDEGAMMINERRRSSLAAKPPPPSTGCNAAKLGVLLALVYLILSTVCIVLHYPLSLLCILIPSLVLFYILAAIRRKKQLDVWTATFFATLGIFIKGAAIITYLSIFDVSPIRQPPRKKGDTSLQPKSIFIIVVLMCEMLAMVAAICLKWHLVAFKGDPELQAVVNQKRKESRVMSVTSK